MTTQYDGNPYLNQQQEDVVENFINQLKDKYPQLLDIMSMGGGYVAPEYAVIRRIVSYEPMARMILEYNTAFDIEEVKAAQALLNVIRKEKFQCDTGTNFRYDERYEEFDSTRV